MNLLEELRLIEKHLIENVSMGKDYVSGLRKGWKKLLKDSNKANDYDSFLRFLIKTNKYIDRLTEDLLINFGGWTKLSSKQKLAKKYTKPQELLRDARDLVKDKIYYLTNRKKRITPGTPEYNREMQLSPNRTESDYVIKHYDGNIDKYLEAVVAQDKKDFTKEIDSIVSGKLFRHLNKMSERGSISLSLARKKEHSTTEFSIGRMKVIWKPPRGKINPEYLTYKELERPVEPESIRDHVPYLKETMALLKKKGFGFLWYGNIFIQCTNCGGVNRLGKDLGVGASYDISNDIVNIFTDPGPHVTESVIHELGHRFYFKFLREKDRAKFIDQFNDLPFVSDYASKHPEEEFAETFTWYVLGKNMTRDQVDRLKTYFRKIEEDNLDNSQDLDNTLDEHKQR
jgi:hypothetical protein